ncbi:hypothetical protein K493DRAFT_341031 [Basidiobolus meristosporus CBS 931.73]|uniref:Uncharacterized protein n=1 Tax=Basidiobolus meristosporus CBS 931.73 TaxID=1314790 RepID=A0A1Y1XSZ4_9FUNG|nr:hypothetical protein K493DRAFT_341031 [Basidiobolus meristosporus CBS 931.73]|eukprot:ORX88843.1 hypothetical protein K493DRAFT_341031 [Basidiobolus meristosporus CBS 931.73]
MSENRKDRFSSRPLASFQRRPSDSDHFDFELVDAKLMWDALHDNDNSSLPIHVDPTSLFLHSKPMPPSEMSELTTSSESHPNSDAECGAEDCPEPDLIAPAPDWIKSSSHEEVEDEDENLPEIDDIDPDLIHSMSDIEPIVADEPTPVNRRGGWLKLILTLLPIICSVLLIQMPDSTLDVLLTTLERHGLFPSLHQQHRMDASPMLTETMCLAPASTTFSYMFLSGCFHTECEVVIVAKDLRDNPKSAGGDKFTALEINHEYNSSLSVYDIQNGRYLVNIPRTTQNPESIIHVSLTSTRKEISNSPLTITWPVVEVVPRADSLIVDAQSEDADQPYDRHVDTTTLPDTEVMPDADPMSVPSEQDYDVQESPTDSAVPQDIAAIEVQEPTHVAEDIPEQSLVTEPQHLDFEDQDVELPHTVTDNYDPDVNQLQGGDRCPIYALNCHLRRSDIGAKVKVVYHSVLSVRTNIRNSILILLDHLSGVVHKHLKPVAGNSISHVVKARHVIRETIFNSVGKVGKYTKTAGRVITTWRQHTRRSISIIGDRIKRLFRRA